jgi:hypothetical protein
MTTEILRNMFYTGTLEGLAHVVLDECHYMGDEGRGTVWEEIIVNAPKDVTLVALSATVANVGQIAEWISLVHRPIEPIIHPHRPVPLQYLVADLAAEVHPLDAVRAGKARLIGIEAGGDVGDRRGRFYARRVASATALIAKVAARHLFHLPPGGLRAGSRGGPRRGPLAPRSRTAPRGRAGDRGGGRGEPGARRL